MTEKPDWCPQETWDSALLYVRKNHDLNSSGYGSFFDTQGLFAEAILQARSQAFEECAKIAEGHRERDLGEASNDYAAGHFVASGRIAQAIRQHSQKGRDKE